VELPCDAVGAAEVLDHVLEVRNHNLEERNHSLEERLAIAMEDAIKGHQWHSELAIAKAQVSNGGAIWGSGDCAGVATYWSRVPEIAL
jgi:hypothetical protein